MLSGADDVNQEGTAFTADNSTVWVGNAASPTASFSGFRFANLAHPAWCGDRLARLELRAASQQWLSMNFEFAGRAVGEQRAVLGGQSAGIAPAFPAAGAARLRRTVAGRHPGISSTS